MMKIPFNLIVLKVFNAQKNQVRPTMAAVGLSPGQPKLLTFLGLHGDCLQKDLAAACDIEPATISKLLNNLEENGLIVRTNLVGDRRATLICLTEQGRKLYEAEVKPRFERINATSLHGFTEAEKAQFEEYLLRMYHNLTKAPLDF